MVSKIIKTHLHKKQLKNITGHKTKKQKHSYPILSNRKSNRKPNRKQTINLLEWPYYKSFISPEQLNIQIEKMKQLNFKYSSSQYKPITFNRRTPIVPITFKGEYVKFIDDNYLEYDILPLIYSEVELLKCKFRTNPSALEYFDKNKEILANKFMQTHKSLNYTLATYREFLFSKVKQCNNFRPTLALQSYNFLNIKNNSTAIPQTILDFSAGWGDRLFAACISNKKYIGLDPNTNNTSIYNTIIKNHGKPDMQKVITTGAEYIAIPDLKIHMTSLGIKEFDIIYTSPPYFDYEVYSTSAQSISSYTGKANFEKWLTYFLFNVIMRYTPLLRENGYIGIYIQDTDKNNFIEPIALFALLFAKQLGLTVCGIISSTRFPFIVLQKIGTAKVLPYINPDNGKQFTQTAISSMFKVKYPVLYGYCLRLNMLYNKRFLIPVLTSNISITEHYYNIIDRTFMHIFMQLDLNIKNIVLTAKVNFKRLGYFKKLLSIFKMRLLSDSGQKYDNMTIIINFESGSKNIKKQSKYNKIIEFNDLLNIAIDEWSLLNKDKLDMVVTGGHSSTDRDNIIKDIFKLLTLS